MNLPAAEDADAGNPRSRLSVALLMLFLFALFAGFVALGIWQVHRRAWKLALIERVEQRVHAAPVPAPGRAVWASIGADDEYLRVHADGTLLRSHDVFVQAVTERGAGYWVLTPLQTLEGFTVLINRGYIDADQRAAFQQRDEQPDAAGESSMQFSGLLRLSEPKGGFLRHNDPAGQRWFSRDVAAIATAEQLPARDVAPYFIDADADAGPGSGPGNPVGGLTVLRFHNSHLVYAITWYALALMAAGAAGLVGRQEWRRRIRGGSA